jgi:hypothetical protein
MQCNLFFPCFKDSSSCLPHFMLSFPCPFSSFVRGQCADHEMWQASTNLDQPCCYAINGLAMADFKVHTQANFKCKISFPNVSKTRRLHLCHTSCVPFWSIWRLWNVASINQPSCNASSNLLQVACLLSRHFPLVLFRHLNYLSGKKLAGRQENLINLANMHWVFTSLGRDNKGCVTLWPCPLH